MLVLVCPVLVIHLSPLTPPLNTILKTVIKPWEMLSHESISKAEKNALPGGESDSSFYYSFIQGPINQETFAYPSKSFFYVLITIMPSQQMFKPHTGSRSWISFDTIRRYGPVTKAKGEMLPWYKDDASVKTNHPLSTNICDLKCSTSCLRDITWRIGFALFVSASRRNKKINQKSGFKWND